MFQIPFAYNRDNLKLPEAKTGLSVFSEIFAEVLHPLLECLSFLNSK